MKHLTQHIWEEDDESCKLYGYNTFQVRWFEGTDEVALTFFGRGDGRTFRFTWAQLQNFADTLDAIIRRHKWVESAAGRVETEG